MLSRSSASLFFLGLLTLTTGRTLSPRGEGDVAVAPWLKDHDQIVPFQQQAADGIDGELELRFKPWLNDKSGCFPYAAVDKDGFHGAGLRPTGKSGGQCRDSSRAQVYSRVGKSNDRTGVLFSWYLPKIQNDERHKHYYMSIVVWVHTDKCNAKVDDYLMVGVSYSTGTTTWDKASSSKTMLTAGDSGIQNAMNTHPIIGYDGKMNVFPSGESAQRALSPPMVSWNKLSKPALDQFNGIRYEHARCPFNENNFQATLDAAFNGDFYHNLPAEPTNGCKTETKAPTPTPEDDDDLFDIDFNVPDGVVPDDGN
ncbi:necrosis inducing protein [Colletotrichum abscissum]|uniref:necrosis inducing protein n=1 Tax=Colletotrichum abscissum TaxID=1671311 RepID=UPI0027D4BFC1|nr:necrosis inducing protein [Colletotrichum abscissum]KAK1471629.1 necrosis inducing protein [Colletotrichum abscissum]